MESYLDYDWFQSLICSYCGLILQHAQFARCGHRYCKKCVEELRKTQKSCTKCEEVCLDLVLDDRVTQQQCDLVTTLLLATRVGDCDRAGNGLSTKKTYLTPAQKKQMPGCVPSATLEEPRADSEPTASQKFDQLLKESRRSLPKKMLYTAPAVTDDFDCGNDSSEEIFRTPSPKRRKLRLKGESSSERMRLQKRRLNVKVVPDEKIAKNEEERGQEEMSVDDASIVERLMNGCASQNVPLDNNEIGETNDTVNSNTDCFFSGFTLQDIAVTNKLEADEKCERVSETKPTPLPSTEDSSLLIELEDQLLCSKVPAFSVTPSTKEAVSDKNYSPGSILLETSSSDIISVGPEKELIGANVGNVEVLANEIEKPDSNGKDVDCTSDDFVANTEDVFETKEENVSLQHHSEKEGGHVLELLSDVVTRRTSREENVLPHKKKNLDTVNFPKSCSLDLRSPLRELHGDKSGRASSSPLKVLSLRPDKISSKTNEQFPSLHKAANSEIVPSGNRLIDVTDIGTMVHDKFKNVVNDEFDITVTVSMSKKKDVPQIDEASPSKRKKLIDVGTNTELTQICHCNRYYVMKTSDNERQIAVTQNFQGDISENKLNSAIDILPEKVSEGLRVCYDKLTDNGFKLYREGRETSYDDVIESVDNKVEHNVLNEGSTFKQVNVSDIHEGISSHDVEAQDDWHRDGVDGPDVQNHLESVSEWSENEIGYSHPEASDDLAPAFNPNGLSVDDEKDMFIAQTPSQKDAFTIMATLFSDKTKELLSRFQEKFGVAVAEKFDTRAEFVVIGDKDFQYTSKVLFGLANLCSFPTFTWLEECLQSDSIVPVKNYLSLSLSAASRTDKMFLRDFGFAMLNENNIIGDDDLQILLQVCGATFHSLNSLREVSCKLKMLLAFNNSYQPEYNEVSQAFNAPVINFDFVVACLASGRVTTVTDYVLSSKQPAKQLVDFGYPARLIDSFYDADESF